jgi:hypothetical protein
MAKRNRRTKAAYQELFEDPTSMFEGVKVTLFPNGEPEIWLQSADGRHGVKIHASRGDAGFGVSVESFVGTKPITTFAGVTKGEGRDADRVEMVQYDSTPYAAAFRAWIEYRGPSPGRKDEWNAKHQAS